MTNFIDNAETLMSNYRGKAEGTFIVKTQDFDPLEVLYTFMPFYNSEEFLFVHRTIPMYMDETDVEEIPCGWFCTIIICGWEPESDGYRIIEYQVFYDEDYSFFVIEE